MDENNLLTLEKLKNQFEGYGKTNKLDVYITYNFNTFLSDKKYLHWPSEVLSPPSETILHWASEEPSPPSATIFQWESEEYSSPRVNLKFRKKIKVI